MTNRIPTSARLFLGIVLALFLAACAHERLIADARESVRVGEHERARRILDEAASRYPENAAVRAAVAQVKLESLNRLMAEAADQRSRGKYDEAGKTLERALVFDAGGQRVSGLLADLERERRQQEVLKDAQGLIAGNQLAAARRQLTAALKDSPRHHELNALLRQTETRMRLSQSKSPIALAEDRPISLDFRDAGLRTVLDVVTRNSGVNFVLDKDVRSDVKISVYLRSVRLEDAVDLIASTHGLAKKVVDPRTILVYPNTPEKQREYQEQVIRVFHFASAEAKGAAAFLRSMIRIREPHVDERANFLAVRDTPENIELAERLVALYDSQEPEVLLDLEVIEIRTTRLLDLGVKLPDAISLSLIPPLGGLTAGNVSALTRASVGVGVGSALISFKREVGDFNTLANPRIRARNKEKAKVLIGDKVPVITATMGQGGFVSDSVSYLDVGLKLEVEPTVYADDEVAIRIALEVSSVAREIRTNSGSLAYQVGTRNASTALRLRDGETQLLAGLISHEDRSSASRVPGLGDLPIAGRLFSSQRDDTNRTEIVLAVTPRILRNLRQPDATESELWIGTEMNTRLRPPGGRPLVIEDVPSSQSDSKQPPASRFGGAGDASPPPAAGPLQVKWRAPSEVTMGDVFEVTVALNSGFPLRGGPLQLAFDAQKLLLMEVREGDYFKQGDTQTSFSQDVDVASGRADFGILRSVGSGATGQGSVITLTFKATALGTAEIGVKSFSPVVVGDASPGIELPSVLRVGIK